MKLGFSSPEGELVSLGVELSPVLCRLVAEVSRCVALPVRLSPLQCKSLLLACRSASNEAAKWCGASVPRTRYSWEYAGGGFGVGSLVTAEDEGRPVEGCPVEGRTVEGRTVEGRTKKSAAKDEVVSVSSPAEVDGEGCSLPVFEMPRGIGSRYHAKFKALRDLSDEDLADVILFTLRLEHVLSSCMMYHSKAYNVSLDGEIMSHLSSGSLKTKEDLLSCSQRVFRGLLWSEFVQAKFPVSCILFDEVDHVESAA